MRGKRSKQYRKLIQQYSIHFGFREPYQVIVDADFVKDTTRCKMDLVAALERTLHGKVKPLITQCSIRHLYASNSDPVVREAIEVAKTACERRRCGHHPDSHPEPLSTLECLSSVVDGKADGTNRHRYCVASQEQEVRRAMRGVRGVPLVYVNRSVMILEPMPDATRKVCEGEEKGKLRDGFVRNLRGKTAAGEKRKREDEDEDEEGDEERGTGSDGQEEGGQEKQKKKTKKKQYGKKEPNPLSVQKPKKRMTEEQKLEDELRIIMKKKRENADAEEARARTEDGGEGAADHKPKRKRRRRHKAAGGDGGDGEAGHDGEGGDGDGGAQDVAKTAGEGGGADAVKESATTVEA